MTEKTTSVATTQQGGAISGAVNFFDPAQFDTAQRMAKLFSVSMLVPDAYQADKVVTDIIRKARMDMDEKTAKKQAEMTAIANCMIALDIAARIGASPLMVMQNLVIIYGRPSWSSKFLISTVNTCGRFEPLKFRFTEKGNLGKFSYTDYGWDEVSRSKKAFTREFDGSKVRDIECVAYTTAKGSQDVLESSPISLRMAVDEGWYTKNGSKWRTMPRQMLMYRAASFWTSVYAPELSMGMKTVEEQQDIIDITDTVEEVETEKASNANKVVVGFDQPNGTDKTATATVDTETGEIIKQEEWPKTEEKPANGDNLFPNEPGY